MKKIILINFPQYSGNKTSMTYFYKEICHMLEDKFDLYYTCHKSGCKCLDANKVVGVYQGESKIIKLLSLVSLYFKIYAFSIRKNAKIVNISQAWVTPFLSSVNIVHDIIQIDSAKGFNKYYYKYVVLKALEKSELNIAVSKNTQYELQKYKISSKQIYIWFDFERFQIKSQSVKKIDYLFVGTTAPNKRYYMFDDLIQEFPKNKFCAVMPSRDIEFLRQQNLIRSNCIYLSDLSEDAYIEVLSNSKKLISPSKSEGFGMPPMEAYASGSTLILSDIKVYKEIYEGLADFFISNKAGDLLKQACKNEKLNRVGGINSDLIEKLIRKMNLKNL